MSPDESPPIPATAPATGVGGSAPDAGRGQRTGPRLGTFVGVFTPTLLTILGVIMYLRLGWVVGQVGLGDALLVIALANGITLVTTLSFSAVATNQRIGVGGAYHIISRALGVEVGGAIGVPLFLSQVLSVTLYAFGLAESLRFVWPDVPVQAAAAVIIVLVGALAFKGADIALRVQVPLMVAIGISLAMLGIGVAISDPIVTLPEGVVPTPHEHVGFWVVFAVFFPAVTGIMAGLGLSGDLRDPRHSLPRGAIGAVVTGLVVYLALPFVLSRAASAEVLRHDPLVWTRVAPLGAWLILPGLWGAIFSSAVGSILGAPRTLQALALDRLAPAAFGRGSAGGEPVLGLVATVLIALAAVALGNLNAVAEAVSMFFLTVYGMINIVAALETLADDPSWRPRFSIPWPVTLLGGIACAVVMFLFNPLASVVAIAAEVALWFVLRRRERHEDWGDARRGAYEALIRWSLVRLARRRLSARSWRPHVLVFADDVERRLDLVRFGDWFSQRRGVVTVCELVVGELGDASIDRTGRLGRMRAVLHRERLTAFPEVDVVGAVIEGMTSVAQANGIAGLDSNTVLVGWPRSTDRLAELLSVMRGIGPIHKSFVLARLRTAQMRPESATRRIHIWWGGLQRNGDLMLMLAHLLRGNPLWRRTTLELFTIPQPDEHPETVRRGLSDLLADIRIEATPRVIERAGDTPVSEIIARESGDADVVFLGLKVPGPGEERAYARRLEQLVAHLPTVFLVRNSSLFRGELIGGSAPAGGGLEDDR